MNGMDPAEETHGGHVRIAYVYSLPAGMKLSFPLWEIESWIKERRQ